MKKSHGIALSAVTVGNFLITILFNHFLGSTTANTAALVILLLTGGYAVWRVDHDGWTYAVANTVWEDVIKFFLFIYLISGTCTAIGWVQGRVSALFLVLYIAVVIMITAYFWNKTSSQDLINETPK